MSWTRLTTTFMGFNVCTSIMWEQVACKSEISSRRFYIDDDFKNGNRECLLEEDILFPFPSISNYEN